ncbi:MAG: class I SAM-dependent methyltransferase [Acidobacteria bacterium]|nr:class I SAM-dependent methyltransferase [Acidobacteriota bacterium]
MGQRTSEDLQAALLQAGSRLESFRVVLDFGCGCGRTLMRLSRQFPEIEWHGTDVDAESIQWCRSNIGTAAFSLNYPLPPLPYQDSTFDLIYGISVFTHLSRECQLAWIPELCRVLRRGGLLLLTFHGEHVWKALEAEAVEREGFVFRASNKLRGIMPGWYQTAFESKECIISLLSSHLSIVTYIPGGFGDQDVAVARRDHSGALQFGTQDPG